MLKHITIFLLVFTLAQCTIQKRLYNKGYSVSWNRKFQKAKPEKADDQLADMEQEAEELISPADTVAFQTGSLDDIVTDLPVPTPEQDVLEKNTSKPLADTVYIVSKNVPEGVAAACLLAGSMIGSRVAIAFTSYYVAYAIAACAAMFLASFALAIASMIIYSRYRKDYLTNILGKLTFIIDIVFIALAVLIILLAFFL